MRYYDESWLLMASIVIMLHHVSCSFAHKESPFASRKPAASRKRKNAWKHAWVARPCALGRGWDSPHHVIMCIPKISPSEQARGISIRRWSDMIFLCPSMPQQTVLICFDPSKMVLIEFELQLQLQTIDCVSPTSRFVWLPTVFVLPCNYQLCIDLGWTANYHSYTQQVGGLEHVFPIFPYIGNNNSNWLSYFSRWSKPPTSLFYGSPPEHIFIALPDDHRAVGRNFYG